MEKNTVLLPLDDYNKLREFKEEIENGKILAITGTYNVITNFYTESEAFSEIESLNKGLAEEVKLYSNSNGELYEQKRELKKTIDELKEMSIFEFLKWKKKQ